MANKGLVFHLPLSSILAFAIVLGALWGIPAAVLQGAEDAQQIFGEARALTFSCREPKQVHIGWTGEIELTEIQAGSRLAPQIRWYLYRQGGPEPADCTLVMFEKVYVNDYEVWGSFGQAIIDPRAINLGAGDHQGLGPGLDQLSGSFEKVGKNVVRYEIDFRTQVDTPGTGYFEWEGGPLTVSTVDDDGDDDGIPDAQQMFVGIHTGLVAVAVGLLAGTVCGFVTLRRRTTR